MKRSDMRAGQKVAYRFLGYGSSHPHYAEATIIDPDWDYKAAGSQYNGEAVHGSGRILVHTPGYQRQYRAEVDGRPLTAWDDFAHGQARGHLRREKLYHYDGATFEAALVSHVDFASDGTEPPRWRARTYTEGFCWQVEQVQCRDGRYYVSEGDAGFVAEVDPTHLFGAEFIAERRDAEQRVAKAAEEDARRGAIAAEAAERLGLGTDRISVGAPHYAGKWFHTLRSTDEVLVAVPVRSLVELLDRAVSDPEWYARMVAEGVLDALGR